MQRFLPLSVGCLLLVSCARYQYATINSPNVAMNDKLEFVAENDSFRIQYNFYGQNAPVSITIQNKLNVPVYIDWRKSALIVNEQAISYVPTSAPFSGTVQMASYNWNRNFSASSGTIDGKVALPGELDFIPPQAYITKKPMGVSNQFFKQVPDSAFQRLNLVNNDGSYYVARHASFTEKASPLRFKSFITVTIGEKPQAEIAYEHVFYVSEVYKAGVNPKNFWINSGQPGNQYYVKETTGFGKAATGFGVIAGVALITATSESLQQSGRRNGK